MGVAVILCNLPKRYMIKEMTLTHVVLSPLTMYWRIPGHKYIKMDLHTDTIKMMSLEPVDGSGRTHRGEDLTVRWSGSVSPSS